MKNWDEWAGEALKGSRLKEPPPAVLREAIALGNRLAEIRSPAEQPRAGRWPGWMRGLAAASVVGLLLAGGTLLLREGAPSLPDRGTDSMIRGTRVQLQSPSGELEEAPRSLAWRPFSGATRYRVRILAVDDEVLWEEQVTGESVTLPDAMRARLHAAVHYRWSVDAFDADGNLTGRSELSRFRIKP